MKSEEAERRVETNNFRIPDNSDVGYRQEEKVLQFSDENEEDERQEEIELQVSHDIWEKMYEHAKLELEENAKEIHDLKEKLADTNSLLNAERGKVRHLHALNKRLEQDVDQVWFDQEELHRESIMSKQLLASKDKEIESLVAQINLLIQVGTMRRSETNRNRRIGNIESKKELIPQGTHDITIDSQKSSLPSHVKSEKDGGVRRRVSSFFSERQTSTGTEDIGDKNQPTIEEKSQPGFQWPSSDKINQNIRSVTQPLKNLFHVAI